MIDAHEIVPGIWQGSIPAPGSSLKKAGFSLVVFAAAEYQPPAWMYSGVDVLYVPLHDDYEKMPHRDDLTSAVQTAMHVAEAVQSGEKVLITCMAGRNRSGLITALTLCDLFGVGGEDAVRLVQKRRSHFSGGALSNPQFQKFLRRIPARRHSKAVASPLMGLHVGRGP